MKWKVIDTDEFQILHFPRQTYDPGILKSLTLPHLDKGKGVVISGRGCIWLHAYLVHECHPHPFVATYEPGSRGAIVIQRHKPRCPELGSVLPLKEFAKELDD